MLKSTFTAFFRSFTRHPLYALLNLLGLSLGIAVFITLGLFFRFETSFDRWIPNGASLYAVETAWTLNGIRSDPSPATAGAVLDDMRTDYHVNGTRVMDNGVTVHVGAQSTHEGIERVDANFFDILGVPLVAGDVRTALTPGNVILSKAMVDKYYPGSSPAAVIGKTLHLTDDEGTADYRVSGVIADPPDNSDLTYSFIRVLTPSYMDSMGNWKHYGSQRLLTIIRTTPEDAARLNTQLPAFVDRHASADFKPDVPHTIMRLSLYPARNLHLQDPKTKAAINILGLVGLLAFFIAAINYVNLATARAGMRAKEVAVRKTLGATQGSLRTQFLGEALLITLIAALIGLSLVEVTLPWINSFGDLHLKLDYADTDLIVALTAGASFILAAGVLAGLYPAFVLAGFKPAQVLASSRTPAGGRWAVRLREALVVVQFAVVIVFFIMIIGFFSQLRHMKTADLGFTRDGVMITSSTYDTALSDAQRDAIWQAFRALPGVVSVTAGNTAPGDESETNGTEIAPPGYTGPTMSINWVKTGPDYFQTYGGHLLAGRWLDMAHGEDQFYRHVDGKTLTHDDGTVVINVLINREALRYLHFANAQAAIGQAMTFDGNRPVRVVGVIENMRFHSPKDHLPASLYVLDPQPYDHAVTGVRYGGASVIEMKARMAQAWRQIAPDVPFDAVSAADNLDNYYKPDRNRSNLFSMGAGVAALIGCIGLYGMAAFNTSRRSREIGLRKVLGASSGNVTGLLVGQFLRPVIIANLVAWPAAWYGLRQWLGQFDDAVAISPWFFVAATAFAVLIALVTVGGLAMASAGTEPGKALRHD